MYIIYYLFVTFPCENDPSFRPVREFSAPARSIADLRSKWRFGANITRLPLHPESEAK